LAFELALREGRALIHLDKLALICKFNFFSQARPLALSQLCFFPERGHKIAVSRRFSGGISQSQTEEIADRPRHLGFVS